MNDKTKVIIIPVLIFIFTVMAGSLVVFYSFEFDRKRSNELQKIASEEVMGVQTDAMTFFPNTNELSEKIDIENNVPVCESFKNITEITEDMQSELADKYLKEVAFSFEVIGYDLDAQDIIEGVKYSIVDSKTNSSVIDYECGIKGNVVVFDDGSTCETTEITDETGLAATKYKSVLSNLRFPDIGDFFVRATILSSDGTLTKCVVSSENE